MYIYTELRSIDNRQEKQSLSRKGSRGRKTHTKHKLGKDTAHDRSVDEWTFPVVTGHGVEQVAHGVVGGGVVDPVGERAVDHVAHVVVANSGNPALPVTCGKKSC